MFVINEYLRNQVIDLRKQNIKYKEIAEYMEISQSSLYSWLHRYYNFGQAKLYRLNDIVNTLKQ